LAAAEERLAMTSEVASGISSRRVGSIRCGVSISVLLADLQID
jgi:hypothetical protein